MPRYPSPAVQPYVGMVVDSSPILTNAQLPYVGQLGPAAQSFLDGAHGRRLAGLGAVRAASTTYAPPPPIKQGSYPFGKLATVKFPLWMGSWPTPIAPGKTRSCVNVSIHKGEVGPSAVTFAFGAYMTWLRGRVAQGDHVYAIGHDDGVIVATCRPTDTAWLHGYLPHAPRPPGSFYPDTPPPPWLDVTTSVTSVAPLGLGSSDPYPTADQSAWTDAGLREMEEDDDVVGSGVFDPRGTSTVHDDMGVFADHPSMPGVIARNPPFTLNYEVADVVNGGPTVEVPGGGMSYIERDGRPAPIPTRRVDGGYVGLSPVGPAAFPLVARAMTPHMEREAVLAQQPTTRDIAPVSARIPTQSIVDVAVASRPLRGFGDDPPAQPPATSWWPTFVAATLVGFGAAAAYQYQRTGKWMP